MQHQSKEAPNHLQNTSQTIVKFMMAPSMPPLIPEQKKSQLHCDPTSSPVTDVMILPKTCQ